MKVINGCLYIESKEDENIVPLLMGYRRARGSNLVRFEDNVVNRIVLGLQPLQLRPTPATQWDGLEDYQNEDVVRMIQLGNVLNRNKMGAGKTVETIVALKAQELSDIVIVAPKPTLLQWQQQTEKWWPQRAGHIKVRSIGTDITILNYEMLRSTAVMGKLRNHRHDAVVFDEVHKIKNRNTQRTTAAKLIPAGVHIGLTGTPILRKPDDLWSELHAVDPLYSGSSYWAFTDYFCNVVMGEHGQEIEGVTQDPNRLAILHKLRDLVTVYSEKGASTNKRVVDVLVEMTAPQKALYKRIKELTFAELPDNCTIPNGAVLATRLQQATSWPGLFEEANAGAKFEWIGEFCKDTDEQILILTKFANTALALYSYLVNDGTSCTLYTGRQSSRLQQENKERFLCKGCQVLIGTIDAAGTGVDGLQQVARLGIMMEQDWSPEINEQCEDRLNRRGQTEQVIWYYLKCDKTFDKHVATVNLKKADSIRACLEDE